MFLNPLGWLGGVSPAQCLGNPLAIDFVSFQCFPTIHFCKGKTQEARALGDIAKRVEVGKWMERARCCSGQIEGVLRGEMGGGQEEKRGVNFGSFIPCLQP